MSPAALEATSETGADVAPAVASATARDAPHAKGHAMSTGLRASHWSRTDMPTRRSAATATAIQVITMLAVMTHATVVIDPKSAASMAAGASGTRTHRAMRPLTLTSPTEFRNQPIVASIWSTAPQIARTERAAIIGTQLEPKNE